MGLVMAAIMTNATNVAVKGLLAIGEGGLLDKKSCGSEAEEDLYDHLKLGDGSGLDFPLN
jgi:hypothetical protein